MSEFDFAPPASLLPRGVNYYHEPKCQQPEYRHQPEDHNQPDALLEDEFEKFDHGVETQPVEVPPADEVENLCVEVAISSPGKGRSRAAKGRKGGKRKKAPGTNHNSAETPAPDGFEVNLQQIGDDDDEPATEAVASASVEQEEEASGGEDDEDDELRPLTTTLSLKAYKVQDLRDLCRRHRLATTGKRADLVKRITTAAKKL